MDMNLGIIDVMKTANKCRNSRTNIAQFTFNSTGQTFAVMTIEQLELISNLKVKLKKGIR